MHTRRRNELAFWVGCAVVTVGVALHVPMYLIGANMDYALVGMPMETKMYWGMVLILVGVGMTAYGLVPKNPPNKQRLIETIAPPEAAPLSPAHWRVAAVLALALVIDVMKPASLGFVMPGMRNEYGISDALLAWLPLAALAGTTIGSIVWGALADAYGRRAAILLSSIVFIGTSICGAMPSFWWNVFMCLLMGMGAGGMLPVAYALLAEIMPTRHRGWMLVLIGGGGTVGGYLAASYLSALLQPEFGWRIMWFLNLPSGLILIALSPLVPESARFLQQIGRGEEARRALKFFGAVAQITVTTGGEKHSQLPPINERLFALTAALALAALAWGLVTFGILLWLPTALVAEGRSVGAASELIALSTVISLPVVAIATYLYSAWSTKGSLLLMIGVMSFGLLGFLAKGASLRWLADPLPSLTLVIIGSCGMIAILLPYTTECYPLRIRGRATGWIASCSKLGGVAAQCISVAGNALPFAVSAGLVAFAAILSMLLIGRVGHETRGLDLSRGCDPTRSLRQEGE
jgi:putative MFS transporter